MSWLKDNAVVMVYSALFAWIVASGSCDTIETKRRQVSALERIADALEARQDPNP